MSGYNYQFPNRCSIELVRSLAADPPRTFQQRSSSESLNHMQQVRTYCTGSWSRAGGGRQFPENLKKNPANSLQLLLRRKEPPQLLSWFELFVVVGPLYYYPLCGVGRSVFAQLSGSSRHPS
jgi:hypothetical protein